MAIFAHIRPLLEHGAGRLLVGYSGGVDSHVLLHCLVQHRRELAGRELAAVYVDHGLAMASGDWGQHCAAVCQQLGVTFVALKVDAQSMPGESPEAAARQARYQALQALLESGEALLTAHHRDDQAETLLLQLLRGAGPRGLAAMPTCAPLGRGLLLRPLLDLDRAQIHDYARVHDLCWIDDPSNTDQDLDRNYLRHQIFPRLKARWPASGRTLARSARLCAEAAGLMDELAVQDLAWVISGSCLSISKLMDLAEPRRRNVLRYWLIKLDLPLPSEAQLQQILQGILVAPQDRQPCVRWPGVEVRRYRDGLFAMSPLSFHDSSRIWSWSSLSKPLRIPGVGRVELRQVQGQGLRLEVLRRGPLTVRFRQGGERFRPQGRPHRQELKKLLQEHRIPPWERSRVPMLYVGDELVAVMDVGVGTEFAVSIGEAATIGYLFQKTP